MHIGLTTNQKCSNNCNKPCPKPAFGSVIPVVVKLDGKILSHNKETSNLITRFVKLFNSKKLGENTEKISKAFREVDKDFLGEIASVRGVKSNVLKSSNGDFWTNIQGNSWTNSFGEYQIINKFLDNFKTNQQWVSPRGNLWEHIKPNVWARHFVTDLNDIQRMRALGKQQGKSEIDAVKYERGIVNLIKNKEKRIPGIRCFVIEAKTTGEIKHKDGKTSPIIEIINGHFVPPQQQTIPKSPTPPAPKKLEQGEFNF